MTNTNIEMEQEVPKKDYSHLITTILLIVAFVCWIFTYRNWNDFTFQNKLNEIDKINSKIEKNIQSCNVLIEQSKELGKQRDVIVNEVKEHLNSISTTGMSIINAQVSAQENKQ